MLAKHYGDRAAVERVDLDAQPGEVVGLVGPNGAGKTTTIGCALGLLAATQGEIELLGAPIGTTQAADARRDVGFAAQEIGLFGELTVADNLVFFSRLRKPELSAAAASDEVTRTADELDLGPLLSERCRTLSLGQQRLVHVAAALTAEPALVVLDEPTAALDVHAREVLISAVQRRAADGAAVLFSSHYLEEVERLCDRVVVVNAGRVIADGRVRDITAAAGGPRVVIHYGDELVELPGDDVGRALQTVPDVSLVREVTVQRPTLDDLLRAEVARIRDERVVA